MRFSRAYWARGRQTRLCRAVPTPENAARLYVSARTAEYHQPKVFIELDITSRIQIKRVLT